MTGALQGVGARIAALYVHPLKGARAIAVSQAALDERGMVGDRRWMLVDPDDVAVTQREAPRLALVEAVPVDGEVTDRDGAAAPGAARGGPPWEGVPWDAPALLLRAPGMGVCRARLSPGARERTVRVWDDRVPVRDAGDAAAAWCSVAVGVPCRLVQLAPTARRPLAPEYAGGLAVEGRHVPLTDGAPLLLLGQGSVDALAARMADVGELPVGADRFRPNIVVDGIAPHAEDEWGRIRAGAVELAVGSPCPRCVVTTIDQATGQGGVEPLRTLASYRRQDGKVLFGMNVTHATMGSLRVGDAVTVLAGESRDGG